MLVLHVGEPQSSILSACILVKLGDVRIFVTNLQGAQSEILENWEVRQDAQDTEQKSRSFCVDIFSC